MGNRLPIDLFAIIIEAKVVSERTRNTVPAPVTFDLLVPGVYPDRWAASGAQDLGTQVLLIMINQIPYAVGVFHPLAGCLLSRRAYTLRNVLTHPAKLLFTGLTVSSGFSYTHGFISFFHLLPFCLPAAYHLIVASLWLDACCLRLEAWCLGQVTRSQTADFRLGVPKTSPLRTKPT